MVVAIFNSVSVHPSKTELYLYKEHCRVHLPTNRLPVQWQNFMHRSPMGMRWWNGLPRYKWVYYKLTQKKISTDINECIILSSIEWCVIQGAMTRVRWIVKTKHAVKINFNATTLLVYQAIWCAQVQPNALTEVMRSIVVSVFILFRFLFVVLENSFCSTKSHKSNRMWKTLGTHHRAYYLYYSR